MLRLRNIRRTAALSTAALSLAGAATVTAAGTAHASSYCAAPTHWGAWAITACVGLTPGYNTISAYTEADAVPHATDVRIYTQLWRSCDGNRTWQMVDSTAYRGGTHAGPTDEGKGTWYDNTNSVTRGWCSFQAHGWLDESGVTRADSWAVLWAA
ncbi:hypothetical protein GCM10010441_39640 [Kitasatospora paracochleata]|uniref:Secreted protein n=1 Tax=Kitasatospora paracochleata TaxID=58354 RepID=A0ABT1IWR4_9ACTN|nr:hypothetical protein [Kitasatospora paracochleata]MCP2309316.1 hypothetical protein [Kitasatospora paracochleata]